MIKQILEQTPNRRKVIQRLGFATAALTASGKLGADTSNPTPVDVIQFALHLDYVEAEFYSVALTGETLAQRGFDLSGTGTPGPTTTQFGPVNFANNLVLTSTTAQNLAADEIAHVQVVRQALLSNGITPVTKPAINLDAMAAMGVGLQNLQSFLLFDRISADLGTSAYAGGAPILNGSPFLPLASRILAAEAQHAANARLSLARLGITSPTIDGADVPPPPTGTNLFSTNPVNGLVAVRTPGQVLYVLYGMKAGVTSGGFFPNGVNGNINTSSTPAPASNLEV